MAIVEIESVRSKFEPGDSPKGSDYLDLIDTLAALPDISGKQDVVANVSSTEIGYLDGVTSAIQTQINTKAPTASPTFTGTVTIPSGSAITGVPYLATANTFTGGVQQITTASAATVGLIVKGAASQTANLQEWQNSAGTALGYMGAAGQLKGVTVSAGSDNLGAAFSAFTNGAGNKGIIVRATASQTANLQEWQNSAGSVVANITASGGAAANYYNSTGGQFLLTYSQSGGNLRLLKSTATANVPGADTGVLYFRDGTTAGTLKLVVRAGTAGAETTILDNIPQS